MLSGIYSDILAFYLTHLLTYFLAYIPTFLLAVYVAFSLACVRAQEWPTAAGGGRQRR